MSPISGFVKLVLAGFGIAANFFGGPGVGAAVSILQGIQDNCEKVSAHKVKFSLQFHAYDTANNISSRTSVGPC